MRVASKPYVQSFLVSPTFTGDPKAPTPAAGDNDTSIATTAFVMNAIKGPAFSAYAGSVQAITGGVSTKVQIDTEDFDTASCFDSSTNYRFTPNVAGYYLFFAGATYSAASTTAYSAIYKNGSLYRAGTFIGLASASPLVTVTALVQLNGSTDYVEFYATSSSNANVGGNTNTSFLGFLLQPT